MDPRARANASDRRVCAPVVVRVFRAAGWAGLAVFTAHAVARGGTPDWGGFFANWLYNAVLVVAAVLATLRAVLVAEERVVWGLFAAAIGSFTIGELLFTFVYGNAPPSPSFADAFYLAFYPCCYLAVALLVRRRLSRFNPSVWLDGTTAGVAAAALSASVVFQVVLADTHGRPAVVLTNLAYPVGDMLLLAGVVAVFALSGWRPGSPWGLVGAALVASTVADGTYLYEASTGSYVVGTIVDAFWPAAMLLLASAAWRPARASEPLELEGRALLPAPLVCGLVGTALLVYDRVAALNPLAVGLAVATLLLVLLRMAATLEENGRMLARSRTQVVTDALTGLGNHRRLLDDLERVLAAGKDGPERLLVVFDLDGFKYYNDSFGHPAGDGLLRRLGASLARVVAKYGQSYRLGGDEFGALVRLEPDQTGSFLDAASSALTEHGDGFEITSSFGAVVLPSEAANATEALRLADQRLYASKHAHQRGRGQPHEVALQALAERDPRLRERARAVAAHAVALGGALGLREEQLEELKLAAQLCDIGTLAIPDAILAKAPRLDDEELGLLRQHPAIGERILAASPALQPVARVVRATHEHWDGSGYPDGLAGVEIPLAARIVAICQAYVALTVPVDGTRPLRPRQAFTRLGGSSGGRYDPALLALFASLRDEAEPPAPRAGAPTRGRAGVREPVPAPVVES